MVSSFRLSPAVHRFAVTALTADQLYVGKEVSSWFLCNEVVVYVGDISYILYLIHWPLILYRRYYSQDYDLGLLGMNFLNPTTLLLFLKMALLLYWPQASLRAAYITVSISAISVRFASTTQA